MKRFSWLPLLLTAAASTCVTPPASAAEKPKPTIEVVFALDTTGSMSGLIEGAKRKIWSMANQILSGKPRPNVKIGLVAYRDRGDEYVTKLSPLTTDIDAIYATLTELRAAGGGDGPESVNQALHEAVTKFEWSKESNVLKIIYLVGDAPPHMDYADDVKYPDACQLALKNNIIINTVQCGSMSGTREVWETIAKSAEGVYAAIPQDGGAVAVATPFDKDLAKLNVTLGEQVLFYGTAGKQAADQRKLAVNTGGLGGSAGGVGLAGAAGPAGPAAPPTTEAAAARASVLAKQNRVADYDFIDAVREGRVKLSDLKEEELPKELRKLSPKERAAKIKQLQAEREKQLKRVAELSKKRDAYIAAQNKKSTTPKDSFDDQVLQQLRSQAKRINVKY